jgi:hypothetical protein
MPSKPYHLQRTNFHPDILELTHHLLEAWNQCTSDEKVLALRFWIAGAAAVYDMPTPRLECPIKVEGGGHYSTWYCQRTRRSSAGVIRLPKPSVITMLHEFRHAMQHHVVDVPWWNVEGDARAWSLSLYHQVAPERLAGLIRAGKVFHISPEELR